MFEDDVFEAFEYLNSQHMQNDRKELGASSSILKIGNRFSEDNQKDDSSDPINELKLSSKSHEQENLMLDDVINPERHKKGIRNKSIFTLQSEHKKTNNCKRRQIYQIGVHEGNYAAFNITEPGPSIDENIPLNNFYTVTEKERIFDRVEHNVNRGNVYSSVSGNTIIHDLEKKGFFISSAEATHTGKECMEKKPHPDSGTEKTELLDDALKDFNTGNDNEYLFYGRRDAKRYEEKAEFKKPSTFKEKSMKHISNHYEINRNRDIESLGDSIKYFNLSSHLKELETSLEDLKRNKKKKEDHEECFKKIDKKIQKLSFKYHPDKVKNRGGTEKEMTAAQRSQTALNSTRTVLKLLNSAFMEDIGTDHKFGYYTTLNIDSLCNEDEMRNRIYEVIFKIGVISRIKQQNIISEIRKFLIESKCCVHNYLGNREGFDKHRDLALFHLKCCIKGFKTLCAELDDVKEQCKLEKNGENMLYLIQNMTGDSKRNLSLLKSLKKTAKASLKGKYQFFSPMGFIDPYFVLPLVSYVNVILMCNVMMRNASIFDMLNNIYPELNPPFREDLSYMMHPYYLASYCSGNKDHKAMVLGVLDKMRFTEKGLEVEISKEEIEVEFHTCIEQISNFMEYNFKVEDYNEIIPANLLMLDLKKCTKMMTEFEKKEQELSKGIKDFQKKTEKMDKKYEKFDEMMKEAEELNQKVKERLEQSKKFSERVSNALSDQYNE